MAVGDRHSNAGGVKSSEDARAGRRAECSGCVGVGERHAAFRERVDVGRLVEVAAVEPGVAPPEVIRQDEDHIGRSNRLLGGAAAQRNHAEREKSRPNLCCRAGLTVGHLAIQARPAL